MRRSNGLGPTTLAMAAGASTQAPTTSSTNKSVGRRVAGSSPQKASAKKEASPAHTVGLQASRSKKALGPKTKIPPAGSTRNSSLETQKHGTTRRSRSVSPLPSSTPPRRRAVDAPAAADSGAGPSSIVASRSRRSSPQRSRQGSPMQRSSDSYVVDSRRTASSQVPSVKQRTVRGGLSRPQPSKIAAEGSPSGAEITPAVSSTDFGTFSDTSMFAKDLAFALTEIESRVVEGIPNLSLHDSPMQKLQGAEVTAFGSDRAFRSNPIQQRAVPASVTHEDRLVASEAFDRLFCGLELSRDDSAQDIDASRKLRPFVGLDSPPTLRCPPSARSHHVVASDMCLVPGLQPSTSLGDSQALGSDALRDEESRGDEPRSLLSVAEALRRETLELGKAIESWALPQGSGTSKSSTSPAASPQVVPNAANVDSRRYIEVLPSTTSPAMPQVHGLPLLAQSLPSPVYPYMLAPAVPQSLAPSQLRPLSPLGNRALDVRLPSPMPAYAPHLGYTPVVAQGNAALQASSCSTWMQNSLGQVELTASSSPQRGSSATAPISAPAPLVYRTPGIGSWDCVQQLNAVAPRAVSPAPSRGWPAKHERGASASLTPGSAASTMDFSRPLLEAGASTLDFSRPVLEAGEDCPFSRGSNQSNSE